MNWHDMDYDDRCQVVWKMVHDGKPSKVIAQEVGLKAPSAIREFARREGLQINLSPPKHYPKPKDRGVAEGCSKDAQRLSNWQRQREGARTTLEALRAYR